MTLAEFIYLLAGFGLGIPATVLWQRHRHRVEHRRVQRRVSRQLELASVTELPVRREPFRHPAGRGGDTA